MNRRRQPLRSRAPMYAISGVVLLTLAACTTAVPQDQDPAGGQVNDGTSASDDAGDRTADPSGAPNDSSDAGDAQPSGAHPQWQALAREYSDALAAAGDDPMATQDDLLETIVFAGIELLPAGMPLPDLSYIGTLGVDPTLNGCVANFQIDVGMYELDSGGIPRPYSFERATTLMESGFFAAGWPAVERVDMYPESHPSHGQVQGTQYLVDADGKQWRVWISVHETFGSSSAMYCPVS